MAFTSKSDFLKNASSLGKEAVKANKEKAAPILEDNEIAQILDLSENIKKTFEARLSKIRYGLDKNKNRYFAFDFILMSGKKGLKIGDFLGLPKDDKETREKRLKIILVKLEQLGYSIEDATPANILQKMVEAADQLTADKPYATLGLSKYVRPDKTASINNTIIAMSDSPSEEEQQEIAVAAEQPIDFISLGELADNEDPDAGVALTAIAEQLEVDVNDYETWAAFAAYAHEELSIPEEEEAEESSEESSEEYEEVVEVSAEDIEYGESCVGYPGTYTDEDGDSISGTVDAYDSETNNATFTGEDGTEYSVPMGDIAFE